MQGVIIKNISNDYVVKTKNGKYVCKPRGKFRNVNITPLVGDIVEIDDVNNYILEIYPRKNKLIRPSVANIDQALIVTSVKDPDFNSSLLDKMLTIISFNNIKPIICFTKLDLLKKDEKKNIDKYINYYKSIGYVVTTNEKIDNFNNLFTDKLTVFTGQTGAGKSSLLNKLDSNLKLKTGEISKALGRGRHTTRHVELFELNGGLVVDTPGFSSLEFYDMKPIDIRDNMKDMFDNLEYCKYRDCMHLNEDGCYVKKLVEKGQILESRYNNYINFVRLDKK